MNSLEFMSVSKRVGALLYSVGLTCHATKIDAALKHLRDAWSHWCAGRQQSWNAMMKCASKSSSLLSTLAMLRKKGVPLGPVGRVRCRYKSNNRDPRSALTSGQDVQGQPAEEDEKGSPTRRYGHYAPPEKRRTSRARY